MRINTPRLRQIIREEARRVLSTTAHTLREGGEDYNFDEAFDAVMDHAWGTDFMHPDHVPHWAEAVHIVNTALKDSKVRHFDRFRMARELMDFKQGQGEWDPD